MERIVFKAKTFREAAEWDERQYVAMSAEKRIHIARALQKRAYPGKRKDVRACHPER